MKPVSADRGGTRGFTLIELLAALLVLSLLALMSYRGLGAVLDTREHVARETQKWRSVAAFLARFERDVGMAAPRPVRRAAGDSAPAWLGEAAAGAARLEFSRFASADGLDMPRRIGYAMNENGEIELWLWPGLDVAPQVQAARYRVLAEVTAFELKYLDSTLSWLDAWPPARLDSPIPRAVRLRIVLASGEEIVRVYALQT